jgi:hypothetical protein
MKVRRLGVLKLAENNPLESDVYNEVAGNLWLLFRFEIKEDYHGKRRTTSP